MSYSFSVVADTRNEAVAKVESELAKVVEYQSSHEADKKAAYNAAKAFIELLREAKEGECISVSMWGSLSWESEGIFTGASVNVSAGISRKSE